MFSRQILKLSKSGLSASKNIVSRSFAARVSIADAKKMPKNYDEMPNDILLSMAVMGDQEAREERLIREIMSVDNVTWEDAQPSFAKMVKSNRKGLFLATLPYKVGIFTAVTAGFVSIPMIFDYNTVLWFNELYVTSGKQILFYFIFLILLFYFSLRRS
jgi:hypothetical protein